MTALFSHPLARARAAILVVLLLPLTSPVTGLMSGRMLASVTAHVLLVGVMSAVAFVVALVAGHAAWMRHDLRSAVVASGFTAVGGMMVVHGLATPGGPFFASYVPTVQVAGVLALPIGASFVAVALSLSPRARHGRRSIVLVQAATLVGVALFALVGLAAPHSLPDFALMQAPTSYVVLTPALALFGWSAWRSHRVADLTRRPGDATLFTGIVVLGTSLCVYITSTPFNEQFWFGHALEFIGFACISAGIAADLRRPVSSWRLTEHVDGRELLTSSEELLGGYVHALTVTLSQVDPSTWNHSRRVAELAVEVGEELGLDSPSVRRLAVAGLVHDIGKLRIPHSVLHKPGKLTDEEFSLIKAHPDFGAELLGELRGFEGELGIVLGHHEKLSGRGYPEGLAGDEIDLETRIMTACDVYDALTDSRSYKEPWSLERAVALLHEESGESFDPTVVAALEQVVRRRAEADWVADAPPVSAAPTMAIPPIDLPSGLPEGGAVLAFPALAPTAAEAHLTPPAAAGDVEHRRAA
ncbi:MAG: hypothetical protein JWM98_1522 [Thermoleophilia bacterium]|nr:hypothetical protein [Thermoleophilia bacterium]